MTTTAPRPARRVLVARSDDITEGGRLVVAIDDHEIGIFRSAGALYAYENTCPHQGGPVCQGRLVAGVRERLDDDGRSLGLAFAADDPHIVCPWHGFEYRVRTGEHPGAPQIRLTAVEVHEEGGEVRVSL